MVGLEPGHRTPRPNGAFGPRGPRPRGVPLPYILMNCCIDPCGIRTQPCLLEGQVTSPEVERALSVYARSSSSGTARNDCGMWAGRRSNPSLLVFSQALHRLSYQPRPALRTSPSAKEKARCPLRDTGLFESSRRLMADVTCAGDTGCFRSKTVRLANLYSPNYRLFVAATGNARVAWRRGSPIWQTASYRSDRK